MQIQKTIEEILASRIKPRNYSDILATIYNLRKREIKDYFPQAVVRVIPVTSIIGELVGPVQSYAVFNAIDASYEQGSEITVSGRASYVLTTGSVNTERAADKVTAWIDAGRGENLGLVAYPIECKGSEIAALNGQFSFKIPASVTRSLSIGTHYIYVDAYSSRGGVRLTASGTGTDITNLLTYNVRSFQITATTAAVSPTITTQPSNVTIDSGQNATFTVTADGSPTLSYTWYKNGATFGAANNPSFTEVGATSSSNGNRYHCIVSSSRAGTTPATSNPATLTIRYSPSIGSVSFNQTEITQNLSPTFYVTNGDGFYLTANGVVIPEPAPTAKGWYEWDGSDYNILITQEVNATVYQTANTTKRYVFKITNSQGTSQSFGIQVTTNSTGQP